MKDVFWFSGTFLDGEFLFSSIEAPVLRATMLSMEGRKRKRRRGQLPLPRVFYLFSPSLGFRVLFPPWSLGKQEIG